MTMGLTLEAGVEQAFPGQMLHHSWALNPPIEASSMVIKHFVIA